jgi:DNA-directed RNA polymerase subunit RPC12/RpoP
VCNRSVFVFSCVCGREFHKEEKESFSCPDCGRQLVLEWRGEDGAPKPAERNSSEQEEHAYAAAS